MYFLINSANGVSSGSFAKLGAPAEPLPPALPSPIQYLPTAAIDPHLQGALRLHKETPGLPCRK